MFKMKYEILSKYLTKPSKRRSGQLMSKVGFIVAHDTGNPNSTAQGNINYYENSRNEISASAHIFVDDKGIYECIPALTGTPEKAWHVLYDKSLDNQLYGDDANDIAIGVEYSYGDKIDSDESYKRYIWVMAYICYKFDLNPKTDIVGHMILDPQRKTDPQNGLKHSGRSYKQMLKDVVDEYADCIKEEKIKGVNVDIMSKHFKDVPVAHWASQVVDDLFEKGILAGKKNEKGETILDGSSEISRYEVAVLMQRTIDYILNNSK